jgi:type VI secretion system protein VasD
VRIVPIAAAAAFCLAACGGSPQPAAAPAAPAPCEPIPVELSLVSGDSLNGASPAESRPVQVRVYQLKSDGRFKTASFDDIWQGDKEALAEDLVSMQETTVYPGATKELSVRPAEGAELLTVVALFREPQDPNWYVSSPLPAAVSKAPCPKQPLHLSFELDRMQVVEGAVEPKSDP